MAPKTSFSIPMRGATKDIAQSKKPKRGGRLTEEDIPLPTSKGKRSGQASQSGQQADMHTKNVEAQPSGQPPHEMEESHPLQCIEVHEEGYQDFQADEGSSKANVCISMTSNMIICLLYIADTDGPMVGAPEQISRPLIGDGRTDKGLSVLHVHQHYGSQVLRLHWR